jgi:hypothetical protein
LLDVRELQEDARRAAMLIGDTEIQHDIMFDVVADLPGALLGCLRCTRGTRIWPCPRAVACGEHLLEGRVGDRARAWRTCRSAADRFCTWRGRHRAGAAAAARDHWPARFLEAAHEALAYERGVFSPDENNWPTPRRRADTPPGYL